MKKVAICVIGCLFACVAHALLADPDPEGGKQVSPDKFLPPDNLILEQPVPRDLPTLRKIIEGIPSSIPLTDGPPESIQAPEWSAWRSLYRSLDRRSRESIAPVEPLRGLLRDEADAVLQAGQDYLRQLDSIGEEMQSEIRARFPLRNAPPLPPGVDPDKVIQLPYGFSVREILEPEGFYERYDARRELLLDSHRDHLQQLIGPTKLAWLDNHVKTDIAPNVRVVTKARRVPLEELPASVRERAESLLNQARENLKRPDVRAYIRGLTFHGNSYKELSALYDSTAVPALIEALNPEFEEDNWARAANLLGVVGGERAVGALIDFIEEGDLPSISRAHNNARNAAMRSLGYLVNRTGSERALDYLVDGLTPGVWGERYVIGVVAHADTYAEYDQLLSTYAVYGLALSGHPRAGEALRTLLRSPTPGQLQFRDAEKDTIAHWLEVHDLVGELGVSGMYEYYENQRKVEE